MSVATRSETTDLARQLAGTEIGREIISLRAEVQRLRQDEANYYKLCKKIRFIERWLSEWTPDRRYPMPSGLEHHLRQLTNLEKKCNPKPS